MQPFFQRRQILCRHLPGIIGLRLIFHTDFCRTAQSGFRLEYLRRIRTVRSRLPSVHIRGGKNGRSHKECGGRKYLYCFSHYNPPYRLTAALADKKVRCLSGYNSSFSRFFFLRISRQNRIASVPMAAAPTAKIQGNTSISLRATVPV